MRLFPFSASPPRRSFVSTSLPLELPPVQLRMYWHASNDADPANLWLRNLLKEEAAASKNGRA